MLGLIILLPFLLLFILAFDLFELVRVHHEIGKGRGSRHRPWLRSDLHAVHHSLELTFAVILAGEAQHGPIRLIGQ